MQICPFCQLDCADLELVEGRCPRCGGIMQWSEDQLESAERAARESASQAPQDDSHSKPTPFQSSDDSSTIVFPPGWNTPLSESFQSENDTVILPEAALPGSDRAHELVDISTNEPDAPASPRPAQAPAQPLGQESEGLDQKIDALWRQSISSTNNRLATLKGETKEGTVTDTVFSVQQREIRSPDAPSTDDRPVDYELLEIIGQGGVGVVYAGRQASIDRSVAIKMLRDEYRNRQDHRDKFLAEAVLTGELDHPNIVPIYDLGRSPNGELFYSMKNVVGTPWDRVIGNKSLRENLDILLKIADAVAFAHSRGVVHRDLKPENVMLGSYGEVLVMDWGIALPTAEFRKSSSILRSQAMGGTPAYMSPEMATGPVEKIGTAADVYLLGAILFEILTGQPPHSGEDVLSCVKNAAENIIVPTNVTGELMEIATKAMSTLPRRRYRTVQDFQAAIRLYLSHSDSISLSDNAELELAEAIRKQNYQNFSRATFAFEEALAMWPENTPAIDGKKRSILAHAKAALDKGDIDLGLSLLDESNSDHQPLITQLTQALSEREARQSRLKLFKQIAVGLSTFIFLAGSIGMAIIFYLWSDATRLNKGLEQAGKDLQKQVDLAKQAQGEAETQKKEAEQQTIIAESQRSAAELARLESIAQKQKAEESSYFAEAGLVGASLEQNGFTVAAEVLERQAKSPAKSKLRHWEWGRHQYLVKGGHDHAELPVVSTHPLSSSAEAVDCSQDGRWIAVGLTTGEFQLWRPHATEPAFTLSHGKLLRDLAFNSNGGYLATCGLDDQQEGCIKVWQVSDEREPSLVKELSVARSIVNAVGFSNMPGSTLLVAGDDRRLAHVFNWRDGQQIATLFGHMDQLSAVKFSPDDRLIATACLDSNVRVFNAATAEEVQRFDAHRAPVLCIAFSRDGKQIASAGAESDVLLWDVDPTHGRKQMLDDVRRQVKGEQLPPPKYSAFKGHTGAVNDLRFSQDGRWMISGSSDNTLCVWTVASSGYSPESNIRLTALRKQPQDTLLTSRFLPNESKANSDSNPAMKPVARLRGHGGWIRSCCFSADGREIYSGSVDRSWRRWDYNRYEEQRILGNRQVAITDAHYSPNGRIVATAYDDGLIELLSADDGHIIGTLSEGHDYLTNHARFIDGGERLITAAGDNTLRIWDRRSGSQLSVITHAGHAASFALSADGTVLATSGDEEGIYITDPTATEAGRRFRSKQQLEDDKQSFTEPTCVALSDDGNWLVVGTKSGRIEVWDCRSGEIQHRIQGHAESVIAAFCLPGANQSSGASTTSSAKASVIAVTASADGTVAWWDLQSGKETRNTRLRHRAAVTSASLSSDGNYLATSATLDRGQSRIWMWNMSTGQSVATRDLPGQFVQNVAISSNDANRVIVTTSNLDTSAKEVWSWTPRNDAWQPALKQAMSAATWGAITSPSGDELLIYGGKGARLCRVSDGAEVMQYRPSSSVYCLDFSHDGRLLASGNEDGSITLWNTQTLKSERKLVSQRKRAINDIDFNHDDSQLVSCATDGRLVLWSLMDGQTLLDGKIGGRRIQGTSLRLSPDGSKLAIGCDDSEVKVYDAKTLNELFVLPGHTDAVTCIDWSPGGRWIASGSQDKSIRLWSIEHQRMVSTLIGHLAPIHSVQFSNDGLRLVSSSQDSSVKLWDLDNLEATTARAQNQQEKSESDTGEVLSLQYHRGPVTAAEFSPSGLDILSAGADGAAVIWPAQRIPPALRLSRPSLTLGDPAPRALDPLAQITQIGSGDLHGSTLRIRRVLDDSQSIDDTEELTINTTGSSLSIDGNRILLTQANGSVIHIATLKQDTPTDLVVTFNEACTHQFAQDVLRHVYYRRAWTKESENLIERRIELSLLDAHGHTGNMQPETLIIH